MKRTLIDMTGGDGDVVVDETEAGGVVTSEAGAGGAATDAVVIEDEAEDKKAKLPPQALRNADGTITLPLKRPVTLTIKNATGERKETVTELTFHEMSGIDLRLIAQAAPDMQTIVTMARATRMPTHRMSVLFDRMLGRDVTAAVAVVSFLQE